MHKNVLSRNKLHLNATSIVQWCDLPRDHNIKYLGSVFSSIGELTLKLPGQEELLRWISGISYCDHFFKRAKSSKY